MSRKYPKRWRAESLAALGGALFLALAGGAAAEPPYNPLPRDDEYLRRDRARLAEDPEDPVLLREAGISLLLVGAPDNRENAKKAKELLEKAYRLDPDDAYTTMFLGCALGRGAGEASLFSRKKLADRAFELMDKAVEMEPGSYRLRLMRATADMQAPSWCGRDRTREEDIKFLRSFLEPTIPDELPSHLAAAGFLLLGNYHESRGEIDSARRYWDLALSFGTGSRYQALAREKLQGSGGAKD